jgi:hypothetical protein
MNRIISAATEAKHLVFTIATKRFLALAILIICCKTTSRSNGINPSGRHKAGGDGSSLDFQLEPHGASMTTTLKNYEVRLMNAYRSICRCPGILLF